MDTLSLIRFNRLLISGDREAVALFIETHYTLDEDSRDVLIAWANEDLNKFPLVSEDLCSLN